MLSTRVLKGLKRSSPLVLVLREVVLDGMQGAEVLWFEFVGATLDLKPKDPGQSSATPAPGSAWRAGRPLGPSSVALLAAAFGKCLTKLYPHYTHIWKKVSFLFQRSLKCIYTTVKGFTTQILECYPNQISTAHL